MADEYMDSRDLQDRIDELQDIESRDSEEQEELDNLLALKEETEGAGWEHGICFIPSSEFEDYASELFDDCYLNTVPEIVRSYIDYEKWARDLEYDYTLVTYDGVDYLYIEA